MSVLGVITARSGSKGIRDKNIRELNGKPLIAYTIESALQSHYIDEVMVSTDSDVYADIAKKFGAVVPFLRSNRNSEDMSKSVDVLLEVLDEYEKREKYFDNIVMLQPTSPLRTYKNLNEAFDLFYEKNADSVVSVCECEHNPLLSGILPDDWSLFEFIKSENNLRRQELQKFYRLNGAIYISKVTALKEIRSFYGENSYAYIMKQRESIDIDTELDFEYADFLLKR
ncbi:MAG: acylneuraminate cytidylyltransferase family protein [Lachnospiraceae bacterium]